MMSNKNDKIAVPEHPQVKVDGIVKENLPPAAPAGLTIDWVLERLDRVINDTEHITKALDALQTTTDTGQSYAPAGTQAKAESLAKVAQFRETTNQQTLKLLEKMYDDLKPKAAPVVFGGEEVTEMMESLPPDCKERLIREIIGR